MAGSRDDSAPVACYPSHGMDIEIANVTRARIALGALAYAALVAHLLFIPYLFSPLPFDETLRRFAHIPWLQLGSDQNVALASRGLMFVPLGLLLAAWVAPQPRRRIELPALLVAVLLGGLWAMGVNVAQLWFPTRTVSLNNLAAEFVGVIGGALLWSALGAIGLRWWRRLASGGRISLEAALSGYVVLYLVASLTPFDFVTSAGELAEKAASDLYGLWIAPVSCGPAPCALKFALGRARRGPLRLVVRLPGGAGRAMPWLPAVPVALVVATIIELLHFLMVSGVSQGASVFARASGMVLGAATYSWRQRLAALDLNRLGRPVVLALLVPYVVDAGLCRRMVSRPEARRRGGHGASGRRCLAAFLLPVLRALPVDDVQRDRPRRLVCARRRGVLALGAASRSRSALARHAARRPARFCRRDEQGVSCRPFARLCGRLHRGRLGDTGRLRSCVSPLGRSASRARSSRGPALGCDVATAARARARMNDPPSTWQPSKRRRPPGRRAVARSWRL